MTDLRFEVSKLRQRVDNLERVIAKTTEAFHEGDDLRPFVRAMRVALGKSRWSPELLIERGKEWSERYGEPPTAQDWNPPQARSNGRYDLVDRFFDGDWPMVSTVRGHFDSWNAFIVAAGFEPASGPRAVVGGITDSAPWPKWTGWELLHGTRSRYGLTQAQVAERAFMSPTHYLLLETGQVQNPGVRMVLALAAAFGLQSAYFMESR